MSPTLVLTVFALYFGVLSTAAWWRSRRVDGEAFYLAGRQAPWLLVSYGMLGVSISGISFISVPGEVARSQFTYLQMVFGYALGQLCIGLFFLPLYYRGKSASIYAFLEDRFGFWTHRTGVGIFLLAHLTGAALRLYLMAFVLQYMVFDAIGLPFAVTVAVTIGLIWLYTWKGGTHTLILTDTLQTTAFLFAVVGSIFVISRELGTTVAGLGARMAAEGISQVFDWSWDSPRHVIKYVATGLVLTLMTTGLDQAMMQKHLSCRDLRSAQKNIALVGLNLVLATVLFLFLGGALVLYAEARGIPIPAQTDRLYPMLAGGHMGPLVGVLFVIGVAAAAYSSADSSLTGLTTAFCIDFLGFDRNRANNPRLRTWVHVGFACLLFAVIVGFRVVNDQSVVQAFIRISGYFYGPLLGLFAFGLIVRRPVRDCWVPVLCLTAPAAALVLHATSERWLGGYRFGHEIMIVNSLIMFFGLFLLLRPATPKP